MRLQYQFTQIALRAYLVPLTQIALRAYLVLSSAACKVKPDYELWLPAGCLASRAIAASPIASSSSVERSRPTLQRSPRTW